MTGVWTHYDVTVHHICQGLHNRELNIWYFTNETFMNCCENDLLFSLKLITPTFMLTAFQTLHLQVWGIFWLISSSQMSLDIKECSKWLFRQESVLKILPGKNNYWNELRYKITSFLLWYLLDNGVMVRRPLLVSRDSSRRRRGRNDTILPCCY